MVMATVEVVVCGPPVNAGAMSLVVICRLADADVFAGLADGRRIAQAVQRRVDVGLASR